MSEVRRLAIIGSGPAGYSAATYAARAQLNPLLIGGEKAGGQLMLTTIIENFAGFGEGIHGPELMMNMRSQAEKFGAEIMDKNVMRVDFKARPFRIWVNGEGEQEYQAKAVIVTTGAEAMKLGIPGESEYIGRGVATCAVCDAAFYRDRKAVVVGGGDAAMEDVLALTKFAKKIVLLVRRDELRASKIMQERVIEGHKDKVEVRWNTEPREVLGDTKKVAGVRVENNKTGETEVIETDGFFLAIGHQPTTGFLGGQLELDEKGYVVTRLGLSKAGLEMAGKHLDEHGLVRFPTMTSIEGVFAAGDNVDFRYRQAMTAAGMGTMAALDAEWWLERGK